MFSKPVKSCQKFSRNFQKFLKTFGIFPRVLKCWKFPNTIEFTVHTIMTRLSLAAYILRRKSFV